MKFLKIMTASLAVSVFAGELAAQSNDITKMLRAESAHEGERGVGDIGADNYRIVIQKLALGQEFLLQGNYVFQGSVPSFQGMRSKIVTFKQRANNVILEEVVADSMIAGGLSATKLLAVFPVIAETSDELTFDWAQGFRTLFYSGDWYASDFFWYATSTFDEQGINVIQGYVDEASVENNILSIRHISQIDSSLLWWTMRETVDLRWYLKPYEANPGFTPTESKGFDRYGFFEANPLLRSDHEILHATKFDHSKPIVFSISANTPAEYREAVREGILYWNKAFGSNVIQAVDAPAGISAPNAHHNMVQWINWDNAGFAYADAQMDPRSGEILHAQVFLTSAFAFSGQKRAAMLLEAFNAQTTHEEKSEMREAFRKFDFSKFNRNTQREFKKSKAVKTPVMKGFENGSLCFRDNTPQLEMALADFVSRGLSDAEILKISQDYVREVVAHEIGHTLGLRHNFAGSVAANFTTDQRPGLYSEYLKSGRAPEGMVASSSVMEYQRFEESTMTGDQLKNQNSALTYDDKAIKILYNGDQFANNEIPLFCTDSHAYSYNDCQVFDSGPHPFGWTAQEFKDREALAAKRLASQIIQWSTHPALQNYSIDQMGMYPFSIAYYLTDPLFENIWLALTMDQPLLQVERQHEFVSQWNYQQIRNESFERNEAELTAMGGPGALFPALSPRKTESIFSEVRALLSNPAFTTAMSYGPKPFTYTEEQVNHIMSLVEMGYSKISHIVIQDQLMVVGFIELIRELIVRYGLSERGISFAEVGKNLISTYVAQKDGALFSGSIWVPAPFFGRRLKAVTIPNYAYNFQERMTAALEAPKPSKDLADQLKADMVAAFGLKSADEIAGLNLAALPSVVSQWVNENNALIAELSKIPPPPADPIVVPVNP